jgi:long-subunit acyl-CoA synthetase (AMP-forming)
LWQPADQEKNMPANNTLIDWLKYQSVTKSNQIALRHKRLGIWQQTSWSDVHLHVLRLVNQLQAEHFSVGDTLYLLSYPRPEALLLSLAAQWLGGISAPLDPSYPESEVVTLLEQIQPKYIFAETESQIDLLVKAKLKPALVFYAEPKGIAKFAVANLQDVNATTTSEDILHIPGASTGSDYAAFRFYRLNSEHKLEVKKLNHTDLIAHATQFIKSEHITDHEEALAARSFAASGHIRYLLAPWLIAGFTLNFPENVHTRDNDRRELGPSFVAGTAETYQRLFNQLQNRLPEKGTLRRRFIEWSFKQSTSRFSINSLIARFAVIGPLKDVIGFSRIKVALLIGDPLSSEAERFFNNLGITIKNWDDYLNWQPYVKPQPIRHFAPLPTLEITI